MIYYNKLRNSKKGNEKNMGIFRKIFKSYSEKEVKRVMPIVDKINGLEEEISKLTDEQLKNKTNEFKKQLEEGKNIKVRLTNADEITANVAIAAVTAQNGANGVVQTVGSGYWDPTKAFGEIIAQGNPDGTDVQTLLDNLVESVSQPTE